MRKSILKNNALKWWFSRWLSEHVKLTLPNATCNSANNNNKCSKFNNNSNHKAFTNNHHFNSSTVNLNSSIPNIALNKCFNSQLSSKLILRLYLRFSRVTLSKFKQLLAQVKVNPNNSSSNLIHCNLWLSKVHHRNNNSWAWIINLPLSIIIRNSPILWAIKLPSKTITRSLLPTTIPRIIMQLGMAAITIIAIITATVIIILELSNNSRRLRTTLKGILKLIRRPSKVLISNTKHKIRMRSKTRHLIRRRQTLSKTWLLSNLLRRTQLQHQKNSWLSIINLSPWVNSKKQLMEVCCSAQTMDMIWVRMLKNLSQHTNSKLSLWTTQMEIYLWTYLVVLIRLAWEKWAKLSNSSQSKKYKMLRAMPTYL